MAQPLPPLARLEAREQGARLHPVDQALRLLRLAESVAPETLSQLPLPERDRRLLGHRRATFGDRLACLVDCPRCAAVQEFELSASVLMKGLEAPPTDEVLEIEGWRLGLRPLDSADLAAAARESTPEAAAAVLLARTVTEALDPAGAPANALPDHLWPRVESRVAEREAASEIALDLACADCGAAWTSGFDIGPHFWAEVGADARRLLGEVAALAARFGWSEDALLAMPPARRRAYLDLAGAS